MRSLWSSRLLDYIRKLYKHFSLMIWILRTSQKPDRQDYMSIARFGLLVALVVGTYSLVMMLIRWAVFGREHLVSPTYPLNIVLVAIITSSILGLGIYLLITARKAIKAQSRGRR